MNVKGTQSFCTKMCFHNEYDRLIGGTMKKCIVLVTWIVGREEQDCRERVLLAYILGNPMYLLYLGTLICLI